MVNKTIYNIINFTKNISIKPCKKNHVLKQTIHHIVICISAEQLTRTIVEQTSKDLTICS